MARPSGSRTDRAGDDLRVEIQIGRHLADDAELLGIFAAEIGALRLDDFEKLQDYRGDAAEMAGARAAFEAIA